MSPQKEGLGPDNELMRAKLSISFDKRRFIRRAAMYLPQTTPSGHALEERDSDGPVTKGS